MPNAANSGTSNGSQGSSVPGSEPQFPADPRHRCESDCDLITETGHSSVEFQEQARIVVDH